MSIASIPEAIAALKAGKPVIVADDENRENEGDVILSAELATQEWVAWTVKNSSGLLCAPMSNEIANQLDLPMMVQHNEDVRSTAYTVTVDAARGVTTGISAHDRMVTLRTLADPDAVPSDVNRPGHVLPLRAVDGGVRERAGHTEASVELMLLAGLRPVAMIAEIVADDGEMMRMPGLLELGARENVPVTTIEKLIEYLEEQDGAGACRAGAGVDRVVADTIEVADGTGPAEKCASADRENSGETGTETSVKPGCEAGTGAENQGKTGTESSNATDAAAGTVAGQAAAQNRTKPAQTAAKPRRRVSLKADTLVPTVYGKMRMLAFRDRRLGIDHLAIVAATETAASLPQTGALVRLHSECLTGEALGSLKCECGGQLDAALRLIAENGGVVLYLRGHEGRGIGLANKLRAYALQEQGQDTLEANLSLGLPADARDYAVAAEMLLELGVNDVRLLTNNPEKARQLDVNGVRVSEIVPLVVGINGENLGYLQTKRDRMGHTLPGTLGL
ncbi:MAG: GTP cyclohydrolase II [Microbacteriaceae bacterium]|nr:GTP cyclohydrolase II [Microbacteriaceae bacterium]